MNDCIQLSDRMPAVALGRADWTPEETHHLNGCGSCQREWALVRAASHLGDGVLPTLDAGTTSRAVLQRLGRWQDHRRRERWWGLAGFALAASLAALLWTAEGPAPRRVPPGPLVAGLQIPLPELDGLQPTELDSVLQGMDQSPPVDASLESPDLGDLNGEELETVLDIWEG